MFRAEEIAGTKAKQRGQTGLAQRRGESRGGYTHGGNGKGIAVITAGLHEDLGSYSNELESHWRTVRREVTVI